MALLWILDMITRSSSPAKHRTSATGKRAVHAKPTVIIDTNAVLAWLEMFDARLADLTVRQQALLRDLGAEPVAHKSVPESLRELA